MVVGEESIARTFHFEARDEREAEDWVRHIAQAMQAVGVVPSQPQQHPSKWWKMGGGGEGGGGGGSVRGSRLSTTSHLPAVNLTPSLSASPLPPSPCPLTPVHSAHQGKLDSAMGAEWGVGGEVVGVESVLELVAPVDLHPIGRMFLCRERLRPDLWHLLHAIPLAHPLTPLIRTAHHRMSQLHALPHLLTPLAHSSSLSDALIAVYTPALHPAHTLAHLLHLHRRLPSPAVLHIAIHLTRALCALHSCGYHYPTLTPSTLALDGDGALTLIDPLFSLSPRLPPSDPSHPYTLPPHEAEASHADWWRVGILLYELSVGLPPMRAGDEGRVEGGGSGGMEGGEGGGRWEGWHPLALVFPPFVGEALQSLIRRLMMVEVEERLGCGGGEGGEGGVKSHPFFAGVDWDADLAPPAWVKLHVMKQPARASLGAASSNASAASGGVVSTTPPSPSTAFTFSPRDPPPLLFFPSSLAVTEQGPLSAYLQQRPPRNVLRHPPAASPAVPPASLHLTLLGGRNFPPPSPHSQPHASPLKRRTLEAPSAHSSPSVATHGVYVTVTCTGVSCTSRMVVGPAACHPHFGDDMRWGLEGVEGWEEGEVEMEVKWGRIGGGGGGGGVGGGVGEGVRVGSVSLSLANVQAMCGGVGGEMWHSIIDGQGLVVGELHVQWRWEREGDGEGPWWVRLRGEGKGEGPTFQQAFGVPLEGGEERIEGGQGEEGEGEVGEAQRKGKGEVGEEREREEEDASDVRVHLGGALST